MYIAWACFRNVFFFFILFDFSNIKLSSPMINNIIIGGSILMYVCVFMTALDYGYMLKPNFTDKICMVCTMLNSYNAYLVKIYNIAQ